jgi:hypothetical protein
MCVTPEDSSLIPPPFRGRVAERSEAGWGSCAFAEVPPPAAAGGGGGPPCAFADDPHPARRLRGSPPSPFQGEG